MQVHVSETRLEHEECKERHGGLTPVRYFDSLGLFDVPVTAAHCVWVDDGDIDILAQRGVFVAVNPASNMKLGSGFAPVPKMLERGVEVCLGTDGMASNNNHDLMQDLYLLALLYKGSTGDPAAVEPKQALRAATRAGALSQGREDCGLVAVGAKADLCVLDVTGPSWAPMTNPLVNVVYAGHGADVRLTMCDGRTVYHDGAWPTLDVERAKAEGGRPHEAHRRRAVKNARTARPARSAGAFSLPRQRPASGRLQANGVVLLEIRGMGVRKGVFGSERSDEMFGDLRFCESRSSLAHDWEPKRAKPAPIPRFFCGKRRSSGRKGSPARSARLTSR